MINGESAFAARVGLSDSPDSQFGKHFKSLATGPVVGLHRHALNDRG